MARGQDDGQSTQGGWQQQGPPPGWVQQAPPKKKRRWPWIVGGVVLLIIVVQMANGGDGAQTETAAPVAGGESAPAQNSDQTIGSEGRITYEVTGKTGGASSGADIGTSVTYAADENFNIAQENGVDLPWTKTVDMGDSLFSMTSLSAQAGDGVTSITCRILKGDEVISENTSTGQFAVVTCSGN